MYARSDITQLARGNAYNRLQWEEVTVGQALALAQLAAPAWPAQPGAQARTHLLRLGCALAAVGTSGCFAPRTHTRGHLSCCNTSIAGFCCLDG